MLGTGGTGTSSNRGVALLDSSSIRVSGGTGTLNITGTGGQATGGDNMGIHIENNATVSTAGGQINVLGKSIATGTDFNLGVRVYSGGAGSSAIEGGANVTVTGLASATTTGNFNDGVIVAGLNARITAVGTIDVTGVAGTLAKGSQNDGVEIDGTTARIVGGGTSPSPARAVAAQPPRYRVLITTASASKALA